MRNINIRLLLLLLTKPFMNSPGTNKLFLRVKMSRHRLLLEKHMYMYNRWNDLISFPKIVCFFSLLECHSQEILMKVYFINPQPDDDYLSVARFVLGVFSFARRFPIHTFIEKTKCYKRHKSIRIEQKEQS